MDPVPNVMSRDLIKSEHRPSDILKEHSRYCELEREVRHFKGPVLAYVTPVSKISIKQCLEYLGAQNKQQLI